ncbi:protein TIME FOR COFFEE isoform X2 [Hevea brasiliensis]|uniref:protein TIME FOR COFFEE isoform X2 n=1 Tax=Hevea brasiliensis TaxID=3981 RepID=UPI0025F2BC46|nr:protein TIME FOR COFFEE isoform X2 [Hevea brasiliensis]
MERNREARRVSMAAANGLASRRRHRSGSLRDSPEDDGPVELQESARLRDRVTGKKDRDRDRDRERDRDRDRERDRDRDRDRIINRGKRRRGDRLMHGSNREDGGDESSEESVNDDEDDEDDDGGGVGSSMRMPPPNPSSLSSSSMSNHHHRKSFPPPAKVFRAAPATALWKAPDEMIGVSVPRKARSASTKRSHEWASSCGVGTEQIHRQASTSPVRSNGPSVAAMLASASASPAPVSPSSSNVSVKKKMPNGPKQRPPKSSSKFTSSAQEDIEIEIAEVLYGLMRQPQGPTKQEVVANDSMKFDSRELSNHKSTGDAKSRVSSPISNSPSTIPHSSSIPPTNSSSSATPMSAIAPKRKRPRPVKYEDEPPSVYPVRSSPISSTIKGDIDQPPKIESCSPNLDQNSGSAAENGVVPHDTTTSQAVPVSTDAQPQQQQQEQVMSESNLLLESKPSVQDSENTDLAVNKEEPRSPKKESSHAGLRLDDDRESLTATKAISTVSDVETQREEKFQIDLMAPPPVRSSPERDSEIGFVPVDHKPIITDVETEIKPAVKEDDKSLKIGKDVCVEPEEKKTKLVAEDVESHKPNASKERNIDLQLDLEKSDRDSGVVTGSGNKLHHHVQKQQQQQQPNTEKAAQSSSLPLPMSMASWPGGLPHMGYMAPLQGVVSMDVSTVSSAAIQPPHLLFSQPRPKRGATHYYIARNIHYHQQFTRMNPFWPAAAGSALQFGAKACNVNVVPSTDLHAGRGMNSVKEKGQGLAIFPGHTGKEKSSQTSNIVDNAQRKQILLQQPLPPGAPSNILHGPAFIFPLNQQQAAAVRPGSVKSPVAGSTVSSSASNSASINATTTAVAGATAMGFNYPNMSGNETQFLAILQNSTYPIPIPAHVGGAPTYRGTPPQAMPFFNNSFYSSQMIHPQLQQQQPPIPYSQQGQQVHQNPSISSGSSSSQKHLQNQQQRPHGSGINSGSGNLQGFPNSKNQPPQSTQIQQRQQMQNQNVPYQARQLDGELGGEDSPSTADSRVSRANMSIYGQNFAMPIQPPNFALMTPPTMGGATASGNPGERKQQQPQPQGSRVGIEPSQAFAMPFASINGATTAPSLDISSIAQNHAILPSLPEAARHGYHVMAAAAVAQAQQKKNYRAAEEGKTGGTDGSNVEEERKVIPGGKAQANAGQSIAFSRPDLTDTSVSTIPGNTVIDSSARTLNLGSASARATGSVMPASISTVNTSNMQQQLQRNQQQQQQQMIQLQKQHQFPTASARSKTPATSNGIVYTDHISSSSSMAAKFPNALSGFPPILVQSNSSPAHSPQWKNSVRTTPSQVPSPSLSSASPSLKTLSQQQGRVPQGHAQISFAANPKPSAAPQGQSAPNVTQSPSPPVVVGSPTTSSISKSAGGSPRTTSTSTSNKGAQSSTLSSQQGKNSSSVPAQKSSPVGGKNIPSILGHPHNSPSTSSSATKSQLTQQQQQLPKHTLQPAQMLYNSSYMQAQVQHAASSTHTTPVASGFYFQRHRSDQQQQPQGSSVTSAGMLCSTVSLPNTTTTDPAKAVAAAAAAAAASNMKGGGLIHAQFAAAQSSGKPHLVPGFPYVHAVQVKPAEQKQPAAE